MKELKLEELLAKAALIRKSLFQNKMDFCAIANVKSGACSENCSFCAQSAHHKTCAEIYPLLSEKEILEKAFQAKEAGTHRFSFVSSGRALSDKMLERLLPIYEKVAKETHLALCASHGFITTKQAKQLRDAGVTRYHHNLESGRRFYPNICTTHDYQERIDTLYAAREGGLSLCSGGIWGLGESLDDRIEMATDLAKIGVDSVPINLLSPIPGTPLEKAKPLSREELLRSFAIYRIILPTQAIRLAGGRGNLSSEDQLSVLQNVVDSLMIGNYLTTSGIDSESDKDLLEKMGFEPAFFG